MRRRVALFDFPAVGHVNPTVGVIEELVRRGHRVTRTVTDHNDGGPVILVPQTNEQRANALRVEELGLGRLPAKEDVTVQSLREAAQRVTGDASVAERVRVMRERIRSVDGPAVAADAVEAYLAGLD